MTTPIDCVNSIRDHCDGLIQDHFVVREGGPGVGCPRAVYSRRGRRATVTKQWAVS